MYKKHPVPSENFDFDKELEKDRLDSACPDSDIPSSAMRPVNENGYPFNPSTVNYGSNNYNWGFEYKICPLSTNLSQKGNDRKMKKYSDKLAERTVYVGDNVKGTSPKDNRVHTGKIVNFTYMDNSGTKLKFVWILDDKTRTRVPLNPHTVEKLKPDTPKHNAFCNLFATNFMHCHESVELFGNDDQFYSASDDGYYRDLCIRQFGIKPEYAAYYDDKFSGKYERDKFFIMAFPASELLRLFGLNGFSTGHTTQRQKAVHLFLDTYFALSGYTLRKSTSWSVTLRQIVTGNTNDTVPVASWKDIYNLFRSVMRVQKSVRMSKDFEPAVMKTKSGKSIVWNDDTRSNVYIEVLRKYLVLRLYDNPETDAETGEKVNPGLNTEYDNR